MPLSLRQVAFVAHKRDPVVEDLCAVLGTKVCYVDDAVAEFGLENAVMPIGSQFIEVVAPISPDTAAGRYLDRRGGDAGYMVICQAASTAEQQACRERAFKLGVRVAWEKTHAGGHYMQLHPRDTGGCFFEIDTVDGDDPQGLWPPAGGALPGYASGVRANAIAAVEIKAQAPEQMCERWCAIAGTQPAIAGTSGYELQFSNAVARFTQAGDGAGEGLTALVLRCSDGNAIMQAAAARALLDEDGVLTIAGVRITLEPA